MVNSLCERLASIEEECDALAGSEDKAARYLSELDSLREKYSGLETQLKFYKDSNDELSNSYADCKSSLNRAQEKIATLTKEIRSLQDSNVSTKGTMAELESEQRRQMQWLEKENLQLGGELKQVKKELIETKTMLNSLHKTSFGNDEATEDLFGLTNFTDSGPALESSSSKRKPLGTISKSQSSSVKKTAEKKRYLPAQESRDKENTTDLSRSPVPSSAKKQRKINPFSSVKKAGKKLTQALSDDSSPKHLRLGDAEENTAELTSDCKQS
jgi:chromosome segregation ATPase